MRGLELTPEHPPHRLAALGSAAEDASFDTVFAACHYFNRDPFQALDRIAARTDRVRLGPAAANPYQTHPAVLASQVATLQESSEGRAILGLGPGDRSTLATLGIDRDRPLARVRETIGVARSLWAGDRVAHDGTFSAADVGLEYEVATPIPTYVAAQGPGMLRMAATHADGVLFNGAHPADLSWAAEQVAAGLADRPTEHDAFDFAAYTSVSVATDQVAAEEAARPPVAFIVAGAARPALERHDIGDDRAAEIRDALEQGAFDSAFDAVTDRMLRAFCIAGTPEQVADRMAAVLAEVDSLVVAAPLGPDLDEAVDLAGEALEEATRR